MGIAPGIKDRVIYERKYMDEPERLLGVKPIRRGR